MLNILRFWWMKVKTNFSDRALFEHGNRENGGGALVFHYSRWIRCRLALFASIKQTFTPCNIDLNCCVGQWYDGASVILPMARLYGVSEENFSAELHQVRRLLKRKEEQGCTIKSNQEFLSLTYLRPFGLDRNNFP